MRHGKQRRSGGVAILTGCAFILAWSAPLTRAAGVDVLAPFTFDVALSSDYVVHGVSRSQGEPTVQAQLGWIADSGWLAGAWLSTVNLNPGHGPTLELDPYFGRRWAFGRDWTARTDITRYVFRPAISAVKYDYTELRGALSFRDVLDVAVAWSPDYSGYSSNRIADGQTMLTYEVSTHVPATRWLSFNAGIGRRDVRDAFRASYWYWSVGAETAFERVSLALSYIGASEEASELFGPEYAGDRLVATVALRLR